MCRIFYSSSEITDFPRSAIWRFFTALEKDGGRHGNGIYTFSDDKLYKKLKGMPTEAKANGKLIFHTRLATHGNKEVYNCQPFISERYIMAHNGVFGDVDNCAHALGYPKYNDKKYSDSHRMFYIIKKIGILNFYILFRDEYYGVVLIHDKLLKKTFLLKTSGVFTCAELKYCDKYVYASSGLKYWQHKGKIIDIGKGLFRLETDGYVQLDKIAKKVYTSYGAYSGGGDNWWDKKVWNTKTRKWEEKEEKEEIKKVPLLENKKKKKKIAYCTYCEEIFTNNKRYYDHGYLICERCYDDYVEDETDRNIVGIENLFSNIPKHCQGCKRADTVKGICTYGGKTFNCKIEKETGRGGCYRPIYGETEVPSYCKECNWIFKETCWFGGVPQPHFINICDKEEKERNMCNTHAKKTLALIITCDECNKVLLPHGTWKIYNESIMCEDCIDEIEKDMIIHHNIPRCCGTCKYENEPSTKEPCHSCQAGTGTLIWAEWVKKPEFINVWDDEREYCMYCGAELFEDEKFEDEYENSLCSSCAGHDRIEGVS